MTKPENSPNSVVISPYTYEWAHLFEKESALIQKNLGNNCVDIHHIGSTSIPNLAAKPIIDMMPIVFDITKVDAVLKNMETLGYESKREFGMPFRRFFRKGTGMAGIEGYHVHIFEKDNPEIDRHLRFREWICSHKEDRHAYEVLKKNLAHQFPNDRMAYSLGKVTFIDTLIQKSGFEGFRLLLALTPQEWEAYHRIREKEIFEPIGVSYDRNHPTLSQENHFHFVLYRGIDIVSVAHIEFLNSTEAALRSLATDERYKKRGYGTYLLTHLETWMKHQGRFLLKMHAALRAEHFYRHLGYNDMLFDDISIGRDYVDLGKAL